MRRTKLKCKCCGQALPTCPTCQNTGRVKRVTYARYQPTNDDYNAGPGSSMSNYRGEPESIEYVPCTDCCEVPGC